MNAMMLTNDTMPGVNDPSDLTANFSWGAVFEDFDNDGDEDLYVAGNGVGIAATFNSTGAQVPSYLFRNEMILDNEYSSARKFHFRNVQYESGIAGVTRRKLGIDSSGNEVVVNMIPTNRAAVVADYDRDGLVDIFAGTVRRVNSMMFHNTSVLPRDGGNWIQLKLVGTSYMDDQATVRTTADAIGARVVCIADLNSDSSIGAGETQMREVVASHSNMASSSDLTVHFGLGMADSGEIRIFWPGTSDPTAYQSLNIVGAISIPDFQVRFNAFNVVKEPSEAP